MSTSVKICFATSDVNERNDNNIGRFMHWQLTSSGKAPCCITNLTCLLANGGVTTATQTTTCWCGAKWKLQRKLTPAEWIPDERPKFQWIVLIFEGPRVRPTFSNLIALTDRIFREPAAAASAARISSSAALFGATDSTKRRKSIVRHRTVFNVQ